MGPSIETFYSAFMDPLLDAAVATMQKVADELPQQGNKKMSFIEELRQEQAMREQQQSVRFGDALRYQQQAGQMQYDQGVTINGQRPQAQQGGGTGGIVQTIGGMPITPSKIENDLAWLEWKKHHALDFYADKNTNKETNMFGEFKNDMQRYFREHKSLIYTLAMLYLADHFLLKGKLKAKLSELANRLLKTAEDKIDQLGATSVQPKQ